MTKNLQDKYKILIENYNLRTKRYELGKQHIKEWSLSTIKSFLKRIPIQDSKSVLPIQIITNNFLIRKISSDLFFYDDNYKFTLFQTPIDLDWNKLQDHIINIDDVDSIFHIDKKIKHKCSISHLINNDYSMSILPIANIFFLIYILISSAINVFILILLIWLIVFSSYCAFHNILSLVKIKRNPQKIKIEFRIPLLDKIERIDVSEIIVYAGQLALFGFLISYLLKFSIDYILPLGFIIIIIVSIYFGLVILFIIDYFSTNKLKNLLLKAVSVEIQRSRSIDSKQYYLQLAIAIEKKNIITAGSFPKFISILLFLISIFPIISYFYP